jgi:Skp family chaperone for outer membrane proteins
MNYRYLLPAFLLAAMCFAGPTLAQDALTAKVAIANPSRIFSEIQETKDINVKMRTEGETLASQEKDKRDELKSLQEARDQLKPGTPQYKEQNEKLLKAAIEFDSWGKIRKAEFDRNKKIQMKAVFEKVQAAVAEVAKQRGIDLVITDQKPVIPDNLDQISDADLRQQLNQQSILYADPKLDISNDVIALMDKNYKSAGAKE